MCSTVPLNKLLPSLGLKIRGIDSIKTPVILSFTFIITNLYNHYYRVLLEHVRHPKKKPLYILAFVPHFPPTPFGNCSSPSLSLWICLYWVLYRYAMFCLSIDQVDGHLVYFHFLVIMHNAVNIHVPGYICFISLEYISLGNGFSGLQDNFMLNTLKNCQNILQSGCTILHSHQQYRKNTNSEHLHYILVGVEKSQTWLSNWTELSGCHPISQCNFDLHFLNDIIEHHLFTDHLFMFFGEMFIHTPC